LYYVKKWLPLWVHDPSKCDEIWLLEEDAIDEDWIGEFFGNVDDEDENEDNGVDKAYDPH
jgi:hypothetical protein